MNYEILLVWLAAIFMFIYVKVVKLPRYKEGFAATSPGTMVQLRTSHVPTEEDAYYYKHVYPKIVAREIRNMTESDL